jgi:outer membrane protein OmpA-like peptidoglycan-associated protein
LTVQLKGWMSTVVATLVSAVVSVGFVAFAGKAVLWSRFTALQVPADQVVKAVPQSEAVATGASILFIFGFFGALATVVFYLVDRGARATLGVGRALLGLVTLESIMAVVLAYEARSALLAAGVALALILVLSGAALVVTFVRRWVVQEDALRARPSEILRPARSASLLRDRTGEPRASLSKLLPLSAPPLVALGLIAVLFLVDQPAWLVAAMLFEIAVLVAVEWFMALDPRAEIRRSLAIELYLEALEEDKERSMDPRRAPTEKDKERKRVGKRRPYRFSLTFRGGFVMAMLALAVIVFPALILEEWWFAVSVGAAVVLSFGLWRIACLTKPGFIWFGLAVFLSVPLFGALTLMARNVNYPEAQPMALIRKTDGPDESIQGLYVAEANDRVYFANVATEGCGNEVKRHSGRLLWVPSDEVVAMSVGPLQSVKEASTSALEMAYELTPAVETPAAGAISLTGPEKQSKVIEKAEGKRLAKEVEEHAPGLDQRLQNPGPAVRPNFGSGLQLVPEVASPGKKVELRLSRLNGGGFGSRPRNRMLRLNGVPVKVERELTSEASAAEYVATVDGRVLALDKRGVFRRRDHKPEPLLRGEVYGGPLYVKLSDSLIEEVVNRHNGLARGYDSFLEISEGDDGDTLDPRYEPMVKLAGKREPTPLQSGLLRQAWHEGAIAFKVPRHARSGVVTIDCGQLAGSPLLRVATPPVARIEAQMRGGSAQVVLDGRRSRDAKGKRLVEHWKLGRRSLGKHERVMLRLQPRMRPYRVKLTVTNPEGVSGSAELLLLRLPGPLFAFGKATLSDEKQIAQLERARARLESFVRRSPPSLIELDGNADDVGSASFNVTLSLERAKQVRKALLTPPAHASGAIPASAIPVTLRAFGETCPIIRSPGRQATNRRVDIFVLGSDDRVIEPKGCRVGGEEHTTW